MTDKVIPFDEALSAVETTLQILQAYNYPYAMIPKVQGTEEVLTNIRNTVKGEIERLKSKVPPLPVIEQSLNTSNNFSNFPDF